MGLEMVELVLAVEDTFAISIDDATAASLDTPNKLVDYIHSQVLVANRDSVCLSQRAFYLVRANAVSVFGVRRDQVKVKSKLQDIIPNGRHKELWIEFCESLGVDRKSYSISGSWFSIPSTVEDLVSDITSETVQVVGKYRSWTKSEIHETLGLLLRQYANIDRYKPDDHFVYDMGLD